MELYNTITAAMKRMSLDELLNLNKEICYAIRRKSAHDNSVKSLDFREGDLVEWVGKRGRQSGRITKKNTVTATVRTSDELGAVIWKVPYQMLTKKAGA